MTVKYTCVLKAFNTIVYTSVAITLYWRWGTDNSEVHVCAEGLQYDYVYVSGHKSSLNSNEHCS
jgi:hypothetical protein